MSDWRLAKLTVLVPFRRSYIADVVPHVEKIKDMKGKNLWN